MAHVSSSSSTSIDKVEVLHHQLFIVTKVHLMKNWNFNQLHNRLILNRFIIYTGLVLYQGIFDYEFKYNIFLSDILLLAILTTTEI